MDRRQFLKQSAVAWGAWSASKRDMHGGSGAGEELRTVSEVDPSVMRKLPSYLRGTVLSPGDSGYEAACRNWSGQLRRRPGLAVLCATPEDVATVVKFAREHRILTAVRAGGHMAYSNCDGGILLHLGAMKAMRVDPAARLLRCQAGLTNGAVDAETARFGLAAVLGECPSVGIAGLGLGGGLGRLMGRFGALCDNLQSARVVTAEGDLLDANAQENGDLFWAIRGGGGNFGVVTDFEYTLHPAGPVLAGTLRYPLSRIRQVLQGYGEWMREAPDELDALIEIGSGILQYAPDAREPVIAINLCCGGDLDAAARLVEGLRSRLGKPVADTVGVLSYLQAQQLGDVRPLVAHLTAGRPAAARRGFLTHLAPESVDAIAAHCERPPSISWSVALDHYLHGAICRVPEDRTAFSLRRTGWSLRITAFSDFTAVTDREAEWVQDLHRRLEPLSAGRIYLNYLIAWSEAGMKSALGGNFGRLLQLKARYDGTNFFRFNQNIRAGGLSANAGGTCHA